MSTQLERRVRALESAINPEVPDVESMPGFEGWVELFALALSIGPESAREAARGFFLDCLERGEEPTWAALALQAAEAMRKGVQPCPDV